MKKRTKKILALLLTLMMLINIASFSFTVSAAESYLQGNQNNLLAIESSITGANADEIDLTYLVKLDNQLVNASVIDLEGNSYEIVDGILVAPATANIGILGVTNGVSYEITRLEYEDENYIVHDSETKTGVVGFSTYYQTLNSNVSEISEDEFNTATNNGETLSVSVGYNSTTSQYEPVGGQIPSTYKKYAKFLTSTYTTPAAQGYYLQSEAEPIAYTVKITGGVLEGSSTVNYGYDITFTASATVDGVEYIYTDSEYKSPTLILTTATALLDYADEFNDFMYEFQEQIVDATGKTIAFEECYWMDTSEINVSSLISEGIDAVTDVINEMFATYTSSFILYTPVTPVTATYSATTSDEQEQITFNVDFESNYQEHDCSYIASLTEPTCTQGGYTTYTCSICGDSYISDQTPATGHSEYVSKAAVDATCTQAGSTAEISCQTCGEVLTQSQTIAATGHNYTTEVIAPTCTSYGYTLYSCACGDNYKDNIIQATGHAYVTTTVEATCTQSGGTVSTCSRCGNSYITNEIPATGHTEYISKSAVDATCTSAGNTAEISCITCGEIITPSVTIDATGHKYIDSTTLPTCTQGGYTTYTCEGCGDSYTDDYTDPTDHDYVAVITAATCTQGGYTTYTCEGCGDSYADDYTDPTGHDYVAVITAATCTQGGYTTYTCEGCGDSYADDYAEPNGHDYIIETTEANCTTDGFTTYTCEVCGDFYTESIQATGHDYGEWITTTEPTATTKGIQTSTCANCGDTKAQELDYISPTFVEEITVTNGSTWLTLDWEADEGATGYQVYMNGVKIDTLYDGETTYKVTDPRWRNRL